MVPLMHNLDPYTSQQVLLCLKSHEVCAIKHENAFECNTHIINTHDVNYTERNNQ